VLFLPDAPVYYVFPSICLASLLVSIIVSLATKQVEQEVLVNFYRTVRPFGLWKPVAAEAAISAEGKSSQSESVSRAILNVLLGMSAISGLYLFPMYLVGHWYVKSAMWLLIAVIAILALRFTWYRFLPDPDAEAG